MSLRARTLTRSIDEIIRLRKQLSEPVGLFAKVGCVLEYLETRFFPYSPPRYAHSSKPSSSLQEKTSWICNSRFRRAVYSCDMSDLPSVIRISDVPQACGRNSLSEASTSKGQWLMQDKLEMQFHLETNIDLGGFSGTVFKVCVNTDRVWWYTEVLRLNRVMCLHSLKPLSRAETVRSLPLPA